jgi:uncharacterized protein YeaO (DUF488 family)
VFYVKRVYAAADGNDGARFLVDRLWPRGVKKEALKLDGWLKDIAPSDALRAWFGHDPKKWDEFQRRYFAELDAQPDFWLPSVVAAHCGRVSLLYGARDNEHHNAVSLRGCLQATLKTR